MSTKIVKDARDSIAVLKTYASLDKKLSKEESSKHLANIRHALRELDNSVSKDTLRKLLEEKEEYLKKLPRARFTTLAETEGQIDLLKQLLEDNV